MSVKKIMMTIKYVIVIFIFSIVIYLLSYGAYADNNIDIFVKGQKIETSCDPVIYNGTTFVPARDFFYKIGATITWDEKSNCAIIQFEDKHIEIKPNDNYININGKSEYIEYQSIISQQTLFIPLRTVIEKIGYAVIWDSEDSSVRITEDHSTIKSHFYDCGQADCIFIELPHGKSMLIDAATDAYEETLVANIKNLGYEKIDYVVATHPHADHIGGMDKILENFRVGAFFMPKITHTTKTFEKMIYALEKNGCKCSYIQRGYVLIDGELSCVCLSPTDKEYIRLNNYSAVLYMKYKNSSFLFCGDAETPAELSMLSDGVYLDADILKVGHHGSSSSSCEEFIKKITPTISVISVGRENEFGFPHQCTLDHLSNIGSKILRTDICGDINIITDGQYYDIE